MPQYTETKQVCPYLGLAVDRDSHFSYPESVHLCFATNQKSPISLEHQSAFCLSVKHTTCLQFVEHPDQIQLVASSPESLYSKSENSEFSLKAVVLWGLVGLIIGIGAMLSILYIYNRNSGVPENTTSEVVNTATATPVASSTPVPSPIAVVKEDTPTPSSASLFVAPTSTATLQPDVRAYNLSPDASSIGWLVSGEDRGNHFGDSFLYSGTFNGQIYSSGFQFDLSNIPRGAPIYQAVIQLTGLRDDRLAINGDQNSEGAWLLRLLDAKIDPTWSRQNYQSIFNVPALETLNPVLSIQDLAVGKINEFELSPAQIDILKTRIIEDPEPKISFRIDGPLVGSDNLFAWDTGYGPESQGHKVVLSLIVGEPLATPPSFALVVVTSTPTPENVITAAAIAAQVTADATRIGTATPPPSNLVTATPFPDYLVIIPTSTPENTATAEFLEIIATALAQTTGTPTPIPTNAITATPIPPTLTPTPTVPPTLTPTLANYVLITATPTPATVFEAATRAIEATRLFEQVGAPTPLPTHWVTPIVVTATPTPENGATTQAIAALATAVAVTTGTATPLPPNVVTATPTPIFESLPLLLTPTPTGSPTATPQIVPTTLLGKILFRSDREWAEEDILKYWNNNCANGQVISCGSPNDAQRLNKIYVFDLDTGQLGRLTDNWPYFVAKDRNAYSAGKQYRTYNKKLLWTNREVEAAVGIIFREPTTVFAIHYYDYKYNVERQITELGSGWAWDPVWSPTSEQIAFVSNDSADDEIWVINRDGSGALQLTSSNQAFNAREIGKDTFIPELNGFPSWSPDGTKIVFWSNRTGNRQLWIMDADGSDQQLLMGWDNWTPYNDWDPVWVKYLDPSPPENRD